jgi:hypothetical protein
MQLFASQSHTPASTRRRTHRLLPAVALSESRGDRRRLVSTTEEPIHGRKRPNPRVAGQRSTASTAWSRTRVSTSFLTRPVDR